MFAVTVLDRRHGVRLLVHSFTIVIVGSVAIRPIFQFNSSISRRHHTKNENVCSLVDGLIVHKLAAQNAVYSHVYRQYC